MGLMVSEVYDALIDAGASEAKARAAAEAVPAAEQLATKQDIAEFRAATQQDIAEVRKDFSELRAATQQDIAEVRKDFSEFRAAIQQDMANLRQEFSGLKIEFSTAVNKMLLAQLAVAALLFAALKLF